MAYDPAHVIAAHVNQSEQRAKLGLHFLNVVKDSAIETRSVKVKPLVSFDDEAPSGAIARPFQFIVAYRCAPQNKACFNNRSEGVRAAQRKRVCRGVRPVTYQRRLCA